MDPLAFPLASRGGNFRLEVVASSMAIDSHGDLAALGSRRSVCLVDLRMAYVVSKTLQVPGDWEAVAVDWCASGANMSWLGAACGSRCLVWDADATVDALAVLLPSSTRSGPGLPPSAMTDIAWQCGSSEVLSACDTDGAVHIWDMRADTSAVATLHAPTARGAAIPGPPAGTAVRWSPFATHMLASAHDGRIMLWDTRKASGAGVAAATAGGDTAHDPALSRLVFAHDRKVSDLDWSADQHHTLLSCGQDGAVRLWHTAGAHPLCVGGMRLVRERRWSAARGPSVASSAIRLMLTSFRDAPQPSAVWRARFAPAGRGGVVTSLTAVSATSLCLWPHAALATDGPVAAPAHLAPAPPVAPPTVACVQSFAGHSDVIKVRARGGVGGGAGRGRQRLSSGVTDEPLCGWERGGRLRDRIGPRVLLRAAGGSQRLPTNPATPHLVTASHRPSAGDACPGPSRRSSCPGAETWSCACGW